MPVHIDDVTTDVSYEPTPPAAAPRAPSGSGDSPSDIVRQERAAERRARIAERTRAESYAD